MQPLGPTRRPPTTRGALLTLAGLLAAAALLPAVPAGAVHGLDEDPAVPCIVPGAACPDLVTDPTTMDPKLRVQNFPEGSCAVEENLTEPGIRRLLRFTFTTPNVGAADLLVGPPAAHPEWFEHDTCHGHEHFKEYADYRFWTPEGFAQWDALRAAEPDRRPSEVLADHPELGSELVRGHKQGFCVIDVRQYDGPPVPKYRFCPANQGISVGWADEYAASLDGQWIDVTGLAAGDYVLEAEINAERFFEESDYTNNRAWVEVEV